MTLERKYFIDNLRWMAILLLFPFHTSQIWSGGDYSGYYVWAHTSNVLYAFSSAVYPWFMTLLFALAGVSANYSLKKRNKRQYLRERINKLLIPFVFGTAVLAPVMTYIGELYYNGYTGSYLEQYALFFTKKTDLTGYHGGFTPAHLWFLLYLFLISLLGLLTVILKNRFLANVSIVGLPYPLLLALVLPVWCMLYVLNISGKSIGQFFCLFLLGYFLLSKENILQTLKRYRYFSLGFWLTAVSLYTYLYCFADFRGILCDGLYVFVGWSGILALIGLGQDRLNFHNRFTAYFTKASFPIYIIHQVWVVVMGFFVLKFSIGTALQFAAILAGSFALTLLSYEFLRRIPGLRFFFGISGKQKNKAYSLRD